MSNLDTMTIEEKIARFQHVWTMLLPHVPVPAPQDAARWCQYPMSTVQDYASIAQQARHSQYVNLTNEVHNMGWVLIFSCPRATGSTLIRVRLAYS